jgi:hypothetical protein
MQSLFHKYRTASKEGGDSLNRLAKKLTRQVNFSHNCVEYRLCISFLI